MEKNSLNIKRNLKKSINSLQLNVEYELLPKTLEELGAFDHLNMEFKQFSEKLDKEQLVLLTHEPSLEKIRRLITTKKAYYLKKGALTIITTIILILGLYLFKMQELNKIVIVGISAILGAIFLRRIEKEIWFQLLLIIICIAAIYFKNQLLIITTIPFFITMQIFKKDRDDYRENTFRIVIKDEELFCILWFMGAFKIYDPEKNKFYWNGNR